MFRMKPKCGIFEMNPSIWGMRTKYGIIGIRQKCEILWDPKCGMFGMNLKCVILGMKPPCKAMFKMRLLCNPWERIAGGFRKKFRFPSIPPHLIVEKDLCLSS